MKTKLSAAITALIVAVILVLVLSIMGTTTFVLPNALFVLGLVGLFGALLATSCVCSDCECPAVPCFSIRKPYTLWGLGILAFAAYKATMVVGTGTLSFGLGTAFIGTFLILGAVLSLILSAVCIPQICCTPCNK